MIAVYSAKLADSFNFNAKIADNPAKKSSDEPKDSLEISDEAYNLQISAGKDSLSLSKVENNFIIHFDDPEFLNQTIKRGFLIIDDKKFLLSDEVKKKLAETDKKVAEANEKSYLKALMQSEAEVAKQNAEVMDRISRKDNRLMKTAARMMKGEQVSPEDEKELILSDPELYIAAKAMSSMQKVRNENKKTSRKNHYERIRDSEPLNYDTSIPKYKKFETTMILSDKMEVKGIAATATE